MGIKMPKLYSGLLRNIKSFILNVILLNKWIICSYSSYLPASLPRGSEGEASVCNAEDLRSVLGREDPQAKEMATQSSTIAWKIPWMEETGRLQSMGSQKVGHDWVTSLSLYPINIVFDSILFLYLKKYRNLHHKLQSTYYSTTLFRTTICC